MAEEVAALAPGIKDEAEERKLLNKFQNDVREANEALSAWHKNAEDDERYVASHQWDKEVIKKLDSESKPHLVFNQVHRVVRSLSGKEMMNRYGIRYKPRDFSDERGASLITEQVRFHRQQSFAKYEESLAFVDLGITGIGCTEIFTDFQQDPTGIVHNLRVPRREIFWDPLARRRNLLDARYIVRGRWMGKDDFEAMFDADADRLGKVDSLDPMRAKGEIHDASSAWMYLLGIGKGVNQSRDEVLVADYQYREFQKALVFQRPDGVLDYAWKDEAPTLFDQFAQMGFPVNNYVEQARPRYYRCYIAGDKILRREALPGQGFTYKFMTGFEDPESETQRGRLWFGLLRIMRGPQDWTNKVLSQIIHMMSQNPKGAIISAPGVFENEDKAKKEWAQPGGWIKANRTDFKDKIEVMRAEGLPSSIFQVLAEVKDAVTSLVGVNPEYDLGQATDLKRVSGEALGQVKQASNSITAPLVDSFAMYRQDLGPAYLNQIRKYIAEGQAIRVYNGYQAEEEQVTRQEIFGRYDVVVDESPEAANSLQETYEMLFSQGNFQALFSGGPMGLPLIPYTVLSATIPNLSPEIRQQMQQWHAGLMQILMQQLQQPQAPPAQGAPPQ